MFHLIHTNIPRGYNHCLCMKHCVRPWEWKNHWHMSLLSVCLLMGSWDEQETSVLHRTKCSDGDKHGGYTTLTQSGDGVLGRPCSLHCLLRGAGSCSKWAEEQECFSALMMNCSVNMSNHYTLYILKNGISFV
jgi:hypothetical protein